MGCTMLDGQVGRGTALSPTSLAPVGSGGHLLSGSSLSQDCARRVLLGFRGAVRRLGSRDPEMTVREVWPMRGVHRLGTHPVLDSFHAWGGTWCGQQGPRATRRFPPARWQTLDLGLLLVVL